jgi:uncharacterized protein (TIGR02145 family)
MRTKLFLSIAVALFSVLASAQTYPEGTKIKGVTWAMTNVASQGKFAANPEDYGNYYAFEEAQTACPEGWRVPTTEEHMSLDAAGSVWTTVNGVEGRRFGSGSNSIFLPAAGCRSTGGQVYGQGSFGGYWSSKAGSYAGGYSLYFGSAGVYPSININYAGGFAVRCVAE